MTGIQDLQQGFNNLRMDMRTRLDDLQMDMQTKFDRVDEQNYLGRVQNYEFRHNYE